MFKHFTETVLIICFAILAVKVKKERAAGWRESNLLKFDGEIGGTGTSHL